MSIIRLIHIRLDPSETENAVGVWKTECAPLMIQQKGCMSEKLSIVLTSPGIVYRDLLIVGGRTPEALPAPPGDIRAYDVLTGKLRWSFHTIPHPGEYG